MGPYFSSCVYSSIHVAQCQEKPLFPSLRDDVNISLRSLRGVFGCFEACGEDRRLRAWGFAPPVIRPASVHQSVSAQVQRRGL